MPLTKITGGEFDDTANAGLTVSGIVTAISGFSGNLTGNTTGNHIGNVTGNVNSTGLSTFSGGLLVGTGASISSPATNVLALGTNNAEVVRVFSNGFVGINSTAPGYPLDVRGGVRVAVAAGNTFVDIGGDGGRSIEIGAGGSTDTGPNCYLDFHGADATYPDYASRLIRSSGANGNFELSNRGTGTTNISAQDAGSVVLRTNGNDRVIVTSSGNFQYNNGYGSIATVYGVRAWVNFDGGSPTIRGSGNVSSVTKHGTGDHSVNFTNAMPDGNYSAVFTGSGNVNSLHCNPYLWYIRNNYSTTSVSIGFFNDNNSGNRADQTYTTMIVIR